MGDGVKVEYFDNEVFEGEPVSKIVERLDYNWETGRITKKWDNTNMSAM